MSFEQSLEKSLTGYLCRSTLERPNLRGIINEIGSSLPETVIFGGMVREFALKNARSFYSDIDLVSLSSRSSIAEVIKKYNPKRNKLGGFRFVANKQRFDIWSLSDTWAFRHGLVEENGFSSLLKTTFFNLDAAMYHLATNRVQLLAGYEKFNRERILDINLNENPNPKKMAHRAIALVVNQQMGMTPELTKSVLRYGSVHYMTWLEQRIYRRLHEHVENNNTEIFRFEPQREFPSQYAVDRREIT